MEESADNIFFLLREEGIPEELIGRLQEEQMTDLENLEEISSWPPKDISSTLGVPIGLVMPNKFGKRIMRVVEKMSGKGLGQHDGTDMNTSVKSPPIECSPPNHDLVASTPIPESPKSRPVRPVRTPTSKQKKFFTEEAIRQPEASQVKAASPIYPPSPPPKAILKSPLCVPNEHPTLDSTNEDVTFLSGRPSNRKAPPLRKLSSNDSNECYDSAAKAAMSFYKKSLTEDTICFTPAMTIDLISLRQLWGDKFEASEDFVSKYFQKTVVKDLVNQFELSKSDAKNLVASLMLVLQRCDLSKSQKVNALTLRVACRFITPLTCSVVDICRQVHEMCSCTGSNRATEESVCLVAMPPLPKKYVHVGDSETVLRIKLVLSTPGWSVVCGPCGVGKSTRVLEACYALPKTVDKVWIDMRAEISGESAAISCLAAQLGLFGVGGGGGTAALLMRFRKFLLSLHPGSVVVFSKLHHNESILESCTGIFEICNAVKSTISFVLLCDSASGTCDSGTIGFSSLVSDESRIIHMDEMSIHECTRIAKELSSFDSTIIARKSNFLPGRIVALAGLSTVYLEQLEATHMSSSEVECMTYLMGALDREELLCAACLSPLVGMDAFCDVQCAWALCRAHVPSMEGWTACMGRLKAIGWVTQLSDSSDIVVVSEVLPTLRDGFPDARDQYDVYYQYWAEKMSDINAAYRAGKKMSSLFWFDKYRPHFTRLLTAWHSPYPPTNPYSIACKIAGKIGVFCESRMSPTSAAKACRAVLRVIEKEESPHVGSIPYWLAAIDLGRALLMSSQFLEALELTLSCVNELKASSTLSNDKNYTRVMGPCFHIMGSIYDALGQNDNAVSFFNKAIDVYGTGNDFGLDSRDVAEVQHDLANCYRERGEYDQSLIFYLKSIEAYKAVYIEDHIDVAEVLTDLGVMHKHKQDVDSSREVYMEALRIRRKLLGNEHIDVAHSLNNVAVLLHSDGAYEEARVLYEEALPIYQAMLGERHADVAASLNNLGALYDDMGNFAQARHFYEKALSIRREIFDHNNCDLAASINNLAALLDDHGHTEEAKQLYLESLEIYRASLGNNHPDVASSLINLAALTEDQGSLEEAGALYKNALDIFIALHGEVHPDVGSTVICIANLAKKMKHIQKAQSLFERAISIYEQVYGREHVAVAQAMNSLAALLKSEFSYEEAKLLFQESLRIRKKVLGAFHPDVAQSLKSLGILLRAQRHVDAAIDVYDELLEVNKKMHGNVHEEVVATINILATLLKNQSRFSEAEELYHDAISINSEIYGGMSLEVAESTCRLAVVLKCHKKYDEAMLSYDDALAIRKKLLGDQDPLVAHTLHDMALLFWAMGNKDEALLLLEECLDIRRKVLPERHPDIIQSLTSLASLLGEDEKYYTEAKRMYEDAIKLRIKLLGEDHPEIAVSWMNLAHLAAALSKHGDAKLLIEEVR